MVKVFFERVMLYVLNDSLLAIFSLAKLADKDLVLITNNSDGYVLFSQSSVRIRKVRILNQTHTCLIYAENNLAIAFLH